MEGVALRAAVGIDHRCIDRAFDSVRHAVASRRLPAAVFGVSIEGPDDGLRRLEAAITPTGDRVSTDSVFFLASVTKPIIATAVMQLVERGLLDLDAPLSTYIPEFRIESDPPITAWHVLTHTSGIPDLAPDSIGRTRPSAGDMLAGMYHARVRFSPGSRFEYCSVTFYLLAELLTRLGGAPYPGYLERHLLGPAGMVDTTFDPRAARRRLVPVRNMGLDNRIKQFFVLRYLASVALPGGGLFGTAPDLLRFGRAMLRSLRDDRRDLGRELEGDDVRPLLSRETVELMTREHTHGLVDGVGDEARAAHYALGWGKPSLGGQLPGSPRVFEHGGASGTRLWIDPEHDLVFVFLTNEWDADPAPGLAALRDVYEALGAG